MYALSALNGNEHVRPYYNNALKAVTDFYLKARSVLAMEDADVKKYPMPRDMYALLGHAEASRVLTSFFIKFANYCASRRLLTYEKPKQGVQVG